MIRRKIIEDDDENPERWLVSYADFITLLFAFFVVMYAISSINKSKYDQLTNSMGSAFLGKIDPNGIPVTPSTKDPKQVNKQQQKALLKPLPLTYLISEKTRKEREAMLAVGINVSQKLSTLIGEQKVNIAQNSRGVRIDINDSLLFEPGAAELSPRAIPLMTQIADSVKDSPYNLQIEGHTDNTPIHSDIFFSNWELSALRASSVVRMLSTMNIKENRLSATGFGSTQPISENETPAGRSKNRRVAILIMYESASQTDDLMPISSTSIN